jgi:hypothetical protein
MAAIPGESRNIAVESGVSTGLAPLTEHREPDPDSKRYLAALWSEILGLEEVTLSDRFLDVGGNSMKLNIILNRIEAEKGVSLDAEPFFDPQRSSLAALAEQLDAILANTSH